MDEATVHFRPVNTRLHVRSAGDRRLFAEVFRWDKPVRLSTGGMEWFTRDREPPLEQAVLALQHGGPVVGQVSRWCSDLLGLSAVVDVRESEAGDGLLELVDQHRELPCSPAFRGTKTRHSTGVQWRNLSVSELAVTHAQELPWGRLRRWAP